MNKTGVFFTLLICISVAFTACSSPESDGKKAAEKYCDCEQEMEDSRQKRYSELIQKFDSYNFRTRIEAHEKIQSIVNEITEQYRECMQKAEENYRKASSKHVTSHSKNSRFEYAFHGYREANPPTDNNVASLVSQMNKLILSIIPPKPDVEKLKQDMIGRKISEQAGGYHRAGWYWEIKSPDELKEVKIVNATKKGDDYVFDVHLLLQGETNRYEADVIITYVMHRNDDWTIDFLETKDIHIVQTHKYDNCVTVEITGWSGEYALELTNRCDVSLVVAGVVLSEFGGEWEKFSCIVEANATASVGGLFFVSVKDYKIHFIERP
jgi:hypothetical protein